MSAEQDKIQEIKNNIRVTPAANGGIEIINTVIGKNSISIIREMYFSPMEAYDSLNSNLTRQNARMKFGYIACPLSLGFGIGCMGQAILTEDNLTRAILMGASVISLTNGLSIYGRTGENEDAIKIIKAKLDKLRSFINKKDKEISP